MDSDIATFGYCPIVTESSLAIGFEACSRLASGATYPTGPSVPLATSITTHLVESTPRVYVRLAGCQVMDDVVIVGITRVFLSDG